MIYIKSLICMVMNIISAIEDEEQAVIQLFNRIVLLRETKLKHKLKYIQKIKERKKTGKIVKRSHAKIPVDGPLPLQSMISIISPFLCCLFSSFC